MYASIGLALLIAFVVVRKILREQLEFYRNRKRLEARTIVADAETIEQVRWNEGGDENIDGLSQQELAARMREAIRTRNEIAAGSTRKDT